MHSAPARTLPAPHPARDPAPANAAELDDFFAYAPVGVEVEPGLVDVRFGEYLVERGLLDRSQLLRALQLQDLMPNLRIGLCAVALRFISQSTLVSAVADWLTLAQVEV